MLTVRDAFSAVWAPVPENSECFAGCSWPDPRSGVEISALRPIYKPPFAVHVYGWQKFEHWGWNLVHVYQPIGPDISDRPASSFLGFFGPEYDKYVLTNSEAAPDPKTEGGDMSKPLDDG